MRLRYNAPVILTLVLAAAAVMGITAIVGPWFVQTFFVTDPHRGVFDPIGILTLFTYVLGHASWEHLMGNATILLLLGPLLEERYGSRDMAIMIAITAVTTALVNTLFFDTGLLGASGIAFMLIMLSGFADLRAGTFPLTVILLAILFLGAEVIAAFRTDTVSQMAHLVGGLCGAGFGLLAMHPSQRP